MRNCAQEQDWSRQWEPNDINRAPARITPVALGYLGEGQEEALAATADLLAAQTQSDQSARDVSALIALGIRSAIRSRDLRFKKMTQYLPADRRDEWKKRIVEAEAATPDKYWDTNKTALGVFQAAVATNANAEDVQTVLDCAVRAGGQCDRVAAIAGAWAGARFGSGSVPDWSQRLYGWPCRAPELAAFVIEIKN
ncbi:ribosylglycohydrolase [Trichosporon asahii var. asahii CBS 8904]|uniref:Ribosylglycohydrolase n=1 Tax=Trichosporon asahii var. asahii (strain CBS 8904) TaxID=1220162 RepID=K1VGG0_TRIAC|nr:ribosylglycohydrolase [Trichosporon asahii var. asahii CBS 8904]